MHIVHSHALSNDEARSRMQRLTDYWAKHYGVTVAWDGDRASVSGKVKGITFDAVLTVGDKQVEATGSDLNWLVRRAAESYIRDKLDEYLG
jgi:hypothetical protein